MNVSVSTVSWPHPTPERSGQCAGTVEVTADIAQELLEASDQYMLEGLKRLCECAISTALCVENIQVRTSCGS
jgi:hypothetical protein